MAGLNNSLNLSFPIEPTHGGTGYANPTNHSIMIAEGSAPFNLITLDDGELLIGVTGDDPVNATLTAGDGISIVNAPGSITISSTGGGLATVNQTAATVTMAPNTQYINAGTANSQVTYTLPATAALGASFRIIGLASNTGGWVLQANSGQTVYVGNAVCSTAGTWSSGLETDVIEVVCTVANTKFVAVEVVSQDLSWA